MIKAWEVSDAFWAKASVLISSPQRDPEKIYRRKAGAGRSPMDPRKVFEAIVYVLQTGIQWKALPKEVYGSPSAIHTLISRSGTGPGSSPSFGGQGWPNMTKWKGSHGSG